jgi:hypothetical protein
MATSPTHCIPATALLGLLALAHTSPTPAVARPQGQAPNAPSVAGTDWKNQFAKNGYMYYRFFKDGAMDVKVVTGVGVYNWSGKWIQNRDHIKITIYFLGNDRAYFDGLLLQREKGPRVWDLVGEYWTVLGGIESSKEFRVFDRIP